MGFPSETTARFFVLAVLLRETEGGATNLPGCECTGENALLGKELNRRGEDYGKWCSVLPPPHPAARATTRNMNTHSSAKTCGVGAPCACPAHARRMRRAPRVNALTPMCTCDGSR